MDTQLDIKVKDIKIIGYYEYNLKNNNCPLCRQHLMHIEYDLEELNSITNIDILLCDHGYHSNCLKTLKKNNINYCIICYKELNQVEQISIN